MGGAQRLLRAQNIDPTTDAGLVKLRDSAASLENDLGNPDSRLRVLLTKALNGGLEREKGQRYVWSAPAQGSTGLTTEVGTPARVSRSCASR